jgi:hypothetical protein
MRRKKVIVRSKKAKNHLTSFEQLQQVKNLTKYFIEQFQQQKVITIKH